MDLMAVVQVALWTTFIGGGILLAVIFAKVAFIDRFHKRTVASTESNFSSLEIEMRKDVLESAPLAMVYIKAGELSYFIWDRVAPIMREHLGKNPKLRVRVITGLEIKGREEGNGLANGLYSLSLDYPQQVQIRADSKRPLPHFLSVDYGRRIFEEEAHEQGKRPANIYYYRNNTRLASRLNAQFEELWHALEGARKPTLVGISEEDKVSLKSAGYKL